VQRLFPDRAADVRLIPHGVPTPERPAAAYAGGPLHLVYHGRLEEEPKNVSALIHLARLLKERRVPSVLRLVGNGSCASRYREMVAEYGLRAEVEFVGECGWDELSRVFETSHLAVLSSRYEGFCLSLAEAMGAGLPGVAFACGGVIEEYLKDGVNGFLVPSGAVESMADRMEWFHRNPERWQEFSAVARAAIRERYSLDEFGARYAAFFQELGESPRRLKWPPLRPAYYTPGKRTVRSVIEKVGRLVGAWEA
jgi:glycosyltransferase involved in cell wall biosynthesis